MLLVVVLVYLIGVLSLWFCFVCLLWVSCFVLLVLLLGLSVSLVWILVVSVVLLGCLAWL